MYTLKVESVNNDFLKAVQAIIQENKLWAYYEVAIGLYSNSIELSTRSTKELKRLVDILESENFIKEDY